MSYLFSPIDLRGLSVRNRVAMAPMCLYASDESGVANETHLVHYGARALGGVGLINIEATSISPEGRITLRDLGIWDDGQIEPLQRVTRFCQQQGAAVCIQLAHHGRKAFGDLTDHIPFTVIAPSAVPQAEGWRVPYELTRRDINRLVEVYQEAGRRILKIGADCVEIHAAHGYLIHEFLSTIANFRKDEYGGSLTNRMRFLMEVTEGIRAVIPAESPLLVRLSVTDWCEGGITVEDSIEIARALKSRGVDMIDCSSGGILTDKPPRLGPGYQIPLAEAIKQQAGIPSMAVGSISTPELAEEILFNGRADMVALGRELLHNPNWPLDAAQVLGDQVAWPKIYSAGKSSLGCH
jgi:2,4-dienoyl-CoA reductase-like NADH-dependent reductase (Old Yellow Enzyme family)